MNPSPKAIGAPPLPIGTAFLRSVLDLLATGAGNLHAKHSVTLRMREDRISQRLNEEMEALHRSSESDIVNWSMRPARTAPERPDDTFEVDFSFHANRFPRDQRWYLGVEAKKLSSAASRLANLYVRQGVLRFVMGKYSLGHDHAVMLGYVVAAPMEGAVTSVKTAMDRNAAKTRQLAQLSPDRGVYDHPHIYSSRHLQHDAQEPFKLVHLLVDLS